VSICLLVEGTTDKKVIRILLDKIGELQGHRQSFHFRVKNRSDLFQGPKVGAIIQYDLLQQIPDLTRVVVCVDMECEPPELLAGRVDLFLAYISQAGLGVRVDFHLVRYALESWLAADPEAWHRAFRFNLRTDLPPGILEECDPKGVLISNLSRTGFDFRPTVHDIKVAEQLEVSDAAHNCQNFAQFMERVSSNSVT
jgi:Domain of unknown function (DUF4276)